MQLHQHGPSSTEFKLLYEGVALSEHAINARDLVPALAAMDELVRRSNEIFNFDATSASLYIRAHRPGSVEIDFLLSVVPIVATSIGSDPVSSANDILRLLFGSDVPGLFTIIKRLGTSTPDTVQPSEENLSIEADHITIPGVVEAENFRVIVPPNFARLLNDPDIRNAALKLLSPLQQDGIDEMSVQQGDEELERITKDDVPSFSVPAEPQFLGESIIRQSLVIDTSRFSTRSRQWRFYDGNKINTYKMSDENFINEVLRREISIAAGDIFECEVRMIQRLNRKGEVVLDQEILRVVNRRPPADVATQSRFDFLQP